MIIQVSGNYGSGKSTAIKKYLSSNSNVINIKRRPSGLYTGHLVNDRVFVIGDYVTDPAWMGADNLGSYDQVFDLVRDYNRSGHTVIFESLTNINFIPEWKRSADVKVMCLITPLDICITSLKTKPAYIHRAIEQHRLFPAFCCAINDLKVPIIFASRSSAARKLGWAV